MKVLATSAVCFYVLQICFSQQVNENFDDGKYMASVAYDSVTDMITVQVEVKTTGWVGFGFTREPSDSMNHYDVVVGGVKNTTDYLNDFYTQGHNIPPVDAKQSYNLTMAKEKNGATTLRFIRKRDTEDNKDVQIQLPTPPGRVLTATPEPGGSGDSSIEPSPSRVTSPHDFR